MRRKKTRKPRKKLGKNTSKKVRKPMFGKRKTKNIKRGLKLYDDVDSGNEADEDEPFTLTSEPLDKKEKKGPGPDPGGAGAGLMQINGGRRRRKTKRRRRSRKKRTKRRRSRKKRTKRRR